MSVPVMVKPKENALVTRHNNLIEARYSLSLQEQRLFLWLVSEISPDDVDFKDYRIDIKDFAEFIGADKNKNIYAQCSEITKKLIRRVVEIVDIDKDEMIQAGLISSARYHLGKGYVDISFSPTLKPYLLQLKGRFTTIALRYAVQLRSVYAVRMYDLFKQYQTIGERTLYIDEMRRLLDIPDDQYTDTSHFKIRVIFIALREINSKTDIFVTTKEEIKDSRRIVGFRFTIVSQKTTGEEVPQEIALGKQIRALRVHGMPEKEASRIVREYADKDPDRVPWHVNDLNRRQKAGEEIKKPLAWLRAAIRADYRPQGRLELPSGGDSEAVRRDAEDAAAKQQRAALKKAMDALTAEQLAAYKSEYETALKAGKQSQFVRDRFKNNGGWDDTAVKSDFRAYMMKKLTIM
jgi:plasmid replication initiation protein